MRDHRLCQIGLLEERLVVSLVRILLAPDRFGHLSVDEQHVRVFRVFRERVVDALVCLDHARDAEVRARCVGEHPGICWVCLQRCLELLLRLVVLATLQAEQPVFGMDLG